ncbi:related to Cytochrome P450 [Melanopsichium pennsylvanicum]|uniref:Related to Cytochrome P450 n=2 Tax=Melanopsichium pennsylvanicum TaxID=63383 RepID=A0AAJ4XPZ2_9BASI|nr:related to Cytochrome P450 [Melanopsichium pennsylvanicum 4]SNX86272.1 related to Cytochrome P450 [Melanopsichium pennsylvanicum]
MKLELDPSSSFEQLRELISYPISLAQHRPLASLFAFLIGSPLILFLSFASFFLGLAAWRWIKLNVLGTDIYSHFPRPGRTDRFPLITGNLGFIRRNPPVEGHLNFVRQLGTRVYVYRGLMYTPRLFIADPKAMLHMLSAANSYTYEKPMSTRLVLKNFLGEGVLVAEGDVHKRQRKVLQPAFNVGAIRELNPIFMKYSKDLTDKIGAMIDRSTSSSGGQGKDSGANGVTSPFVAQSAHSLEASRPGAPVLDMSWWTTRAALDIIGDAGFGYHFESLKIDVDPSIQVERAGDLLGNAFNTLFKLTLTIDLMRFLQIYLSSIPLLRWVESIPSKRKRATENAYAKLEEVSTQIVDRKKKEIRGEMQAEIDARGTTKGNGFTKADFDEKESSSNGNGPTPGKDLLHLMMRANMAHDISPKEKLDDAELIGQITTLLIAGHETTSNQTAWTLWLLAQKPSVQNKLRAEIRDHFGKDMDNDVGYDELMGMPYLDAICKESFRVKSAVPSTIRVAKASADVPLSKPYPTRDGKGSITSVHIPKGKEVFIPIQAINSDPETWGEDADEFKPERWLDLPESAKHNGLPMHLMTFISGPRGCIGNRFALAEFKAMLCHLVGRFQYEEVEGWKIEAKQTAVIRSRVVGQEEVGPQMPLRVSHIPAVSR